jgi:hypothetical protein
MDCCGARLLLEADRRMRDAGAPLSRLSLESSAAPTFIQGAHDG